MKALSRLPINEMRTPVSTADPGWYSDPATGSGLRWWDGQVWTEHVRHAPNLGASSESDLPYVPVADYSRQPVSAPLPQKLTHAQKDKEVRRNNILGYAGLVLSLIALIVNFFAIPSILGIIFSSIGLARAQSLEGRSRVTGRGTSIAGLVIGIVALGLFAYNLVRLVS